LSIIQQLSKESLPKPDFNSKGGGFEIVFHYEPVREPVNEKQLNLIDLIRNNKSISINELAEKCNVGRETIKRDLKQLRKLNLLKRVESDKTGFWEIIHR
jgi:predicted HTH transcriptional regulator